jgi:hypothetical protein
MIYREYDPRPVRGGNDGARISERERNGLFDDAVLPRLRRSDCVRRMLIVAGRDVDSVNVAG